jgi:hypothetical protein
MKGNELDRIYGMNKIVKERRSETGDRKGWQKLVLVLVLLLVLASFGRADNVNVVNPASSPVRVVIYPNASASATPQQVTDANLGLKSDSAATTDTGTFSLIALVKRALQTLTTISGVQTSGAQKGQVVNAAGTEVNTATTVKSTAFEASHVLKASAGRLCSLQVFNSSGSAQYILVMDSATVPANGAVTLLCPPIYLAAGTYIQIPFPVPLSAANGISVCNSSTGSFTKTIGSADCAFTGQVQ